MRPGQIREIKANAIPVDRNGRTPLHYATYGSQNAEMLQCFSLLLQWGAKPEKQDREGLTVHHLAVINDRPRVVEFLAPLKGMNLKDSLWRTPVGIISICVKSELLSRRFIMLHYMARKTSAKHCCATGQMCGNQIVLGLLR